MKRAKRWNVERLIEMSKPDLEGAEQLAQRISTLLLSLWRAEKKK